MADYLEYFYKKAKFNADETQNLVEGIEEIVPTKKYNKGGRVKFSRRIPKVFLQKHYLQLQQRLIKLENLLQILQKELLKQLYLQL